MKAKLILFAALFIFFSCSNSDPAETARAEKVSYEKPKNVNLDSIQNIIDVYEKFLKLDEELIDDINSKIDSYKKKIEETDDLVKKSAYQDGIVRLVKQKRDPINSIDKRKKEILRLKSELEDKKHGQ